MATVPFTGANGAVAVTIGTADDVYVLPPLFAQVMAMRGFAMLSIDGAQTFGGHAVRLLWRPAAAAAWRSTGVTLTADACENIVLAAAGQYGVSASGGSSAPTIAIDIA